jgi:thiamine biosynthesis lipoprotein
MGTLAAVTVGSRDRERLPELTAEVRRVFRRLESRLSTYQSDSEIAVLAREAGRRAVPVSIDTLQVLRLSKHYGELTGGAFDVTVAPLVRLWGFGVRAPDNPPESAVIESTRRNVGFRRIELEGATAFLPEGMSIDLGGIGKGYAVDEGCEALRRAGVQAAMVDLGGNIRVLGQAGRHDTWTIGVRNPFDRERLLGKIGLPAGHAIATSGNYERFIEMGGRRYGHIIDPRTGYPVEGLAGVTVVCPDATMADALSTALFVLGIEAGLDVLAKLPGAEALFVPDRDPIEISVTAGLEKVFVPLPEYAASVRVLRR